MYVRWLKINGARRAGVTGRSEACRCRNAYIADGALHGCRGKVHAGMLNPGLVLDVWTWRNILSR